MYLSKLQNVFVQNLQCFCTNTQTSNHICLLLLLTTLHTPNFTMYLSKLQNVFFKIAQCIWPINNTAHTNVNTTVKTLFKPLLKIMFKHNTQQCNAILCSQFICAPLHPSCCAVYKLKRKIANISFLSSAVQ